MKKYLINSKKDYKVVTCWSRIAFGYNLEKMDWGKGHYTFFTYYYILFWQISVIQAKVRMD